MAGNDRKRPLKPGEEDLWAAAMAGTKKAAKPRLAPRAKPQPVGPGTHIRRDAAERMMMPDRPVDDLSAPVRAKPVGPVALPKGGMTSGLEGLDRKNAERLRKGKIEIEARIDLHGMRQGDAYAALHRFISEQHARGARCVLVITGKGKGRDYRGAPLPVADTPWETKAGVQRFEMPTAAGVLRELVPRWLREAGLASKVVSYTQAQPKHGGTGALYVYLRRMRDR